MLTSKNNAIVFDGKRRSQNNIILYGELQVINELRTLEEMLGNDGWWES